MKKFRNRKSVDNINNVLDAFLALKDIDDEEVIGMVRNVKKVNEGVDISLITSTNAELDDAREFIKNDKKKDEDVEIEVIDANADAIDHVKNNKDYIGQVILCCNRCHSNKFIDMTDLVPSEEDPNLYNVEEECPFCKESGFGYRVIGQVGKVQTSVENNIEPSVEGEDVEEVAFNTEDNGGVDDEASFDNDVAAEDENSDENSEAEATESEDVEVAESEDADDEDEEEKPFDETSAHEDDDEDDDKSKLGEEFVPEYKLDEEEVSNAFKSVGGLKEDSTNKYAEEAWLMNQVIQNMNNEEAYYGSWLYIWPDGETRKDCEYDFGNKEAFEELKEEFIDTYKAYHSDGLYDATEEVLEYAHKWDKLLDLAPIENFVVEELEEDDDDEDDAEQPADVDNKSDETDEGVKVSNLLSIFIEPENLKNIEIDGDVYDEFDEIPQAVLNKKVKGFNSKDSSLTVYVVNEEDVPEVSDEIIHVVDLLNLFDNEDEKFEKLIIEDAESSEEIFRGNKVGAIAACADCVVTHLEKPETLVINLVEDDDDTDEGDADAIVDVDTDDKEPTKGDVDETLFEEICRENNLYAYKVNRVGSEEYWLNEDLINEDDLQTVYEKYCRGKNCAQRFKEQFSQYEFIDSTEYKLSEALKKLNESGFTADEFDKLNKLAKELGLGDSLKGIQDFAKEHGCNNMGEIIRAMEIELVEKQYREHPEQFYADDKNAEQHLLKQDSVKGAFVSVDGGETWEECSEEEFDELLAGGYKVVEEDNDEEYEESLNEKLRMVKKLSESEEPETEETEHIVEEPQIDVEEPEVIPDEKTSDNPEELNDVMEAARKVMDAYQTANKWLDTVKECVYTNMNCPFFSSLVHELAHTMPARFDTFGDILHTINMEIPYPETPELQDKPSDIETSFVIIFQLLDNIKAALNDFIKITDENYHGMSCSAEACLNDIEGEYPMLYRLQAKAKECGDDTITFDKFVGQYSQHQGELLEGKVSHFRTRKELKEAIKECENNNRPYNVRRSTKEGYRFDLLTEVEEEKPTINDLIADENEAIDGYDAAIRNLANSDVNVDDRFAAIARLQEIKGDEIEHIAELQELGDRLCNAEVECPQCGCVKGECHCHEDNKSDDVKSDDAKSDDIKSLDDAVAVLKEEKSKNSWLASLPTEDPEQSIFEDLDDDDDEVVVEPDEIMDAPDANDDVVDVVPNNLSEEEINVLGKVSRIANDICEAIKNYYDIEVTPALVVADILQDLKLISGAIDISELEDTPINNLTKQMFQNYENSYRLVDDIMTTLTGEPFTTLPETKLRDAINSLDGPQFDKENIERMIRSPKFVAAVEQGMVPYIPNGMNHELIESMKQKVNEDTVEDEIEDKLDIYSDDKVLYDVVAPHVIDLIGNPTTLHYDDLHIYIDNIVRSATEVEPAEYEEKDVSWDYEVEWDVDDDLLPFIETHYDINKFNKDDLDKFDEDAFVKYLSDKYREDAQDDAQTNWEEAEPDYNDDVDEAIDEVEVDVEQFDNFINEYFNENYGDDTTTLLYHTVGGSVTDKGKIVLEGVIKGAEKGIGCEKNVVFTLTPKNNINEKLESNNNDVDVDTMSALGLIDYKVENDLSEETWDFKFINGTPNEEIFKLTNERKLKILKEFLKDAKGIDDHLVPAEVVKEAAIWEYERNKMQYIKMGLDVCHLENKLSEVVDQIDFTPLIENEEPQPQQ